jgi:hypothetical protein
MLTHRPSGGHCLGANSSSIAFGNERQAHDLKFEGDPNSAHYCSDFVALASCYSQGFGKKGGKSGAPAESRPKIDEKAYKAALDRIPTPKKGYDPWGQMRPSEPAKTANKSN